MLSKSFQVILNLESAPTSNLNRLNRFNRCILFRIVSGHREDSGQDNTCLNLYRLRQDFDLRPFFPCKQDLRPSLPKESRYMERNTVYVCVYIYTCVIYIYMCLDIYMCIYLYKQSVYVNVYKYICMASLL